MWTRELVSQLIVKYQGFESLYNTRHPDYMNRVKRSEALLQICGELKALNSNISLEAVKSKLHTLRSQYLRELRETKLSKKSGAGAEDVYAPKLWCYDQLEFLKPYCATRKASSNICNDDEQFIMSEEVPDSEECSALAPDAYELEDTILNEPSTSRKRKATSQITGKIGQVKQMLEKKLANKSRSTCFGEQVGMDIESIQDEELRNEAMFKIQNVLYEIKAQDIQLRKAAAQTVSRIKTTSTSSSRTVTASESSDILQQSMQGLFDDDDLIEVLFE